MELLLVLIGIILGAYMLWSGSRMGWLEGACMVYELRIQQLEEEMNLLREEYLNFHPGNNWNADVDEANQWR